MLKIMLKLMAFVAIVNFLGCKLGGDSPVEVVVESESFVNQPKNYAVVGVTYVYNPIPKEEYYDEDFSVERFTGVTGGNKTEKAIYWTPTVDDIGKQNLQIEVLSGNKNIVFSWGVNVLQKTKIPINLDAKFENGIALPIDKFVPGYSINISPTTDLKEVQLSANMLDVDLTNGAFKEGLASPALVLEFDPSEKISLNQNFNLSGKSFELKISIKTKSDKNPFSPPAPKLNEQYFIVVDTMASLGAPGHKNKNGLKVIPVLEKEGILTAFFTHTFSDEAIPETQRFFMAQLVKSPSLAVRPNSDMNEKNNNFELIWLFENEENSESRKVYVKKFINKLLDYLVTSQAKYSSLGCTEPFVTQIFISPHLETFTHVYKNLDNFTVPYISFSDCRSWSYGNRICSYPYFDGLGENGPGTTELKHAVAHEYFHVAQLPNSRLGYIYAGDPRTWITESSAEFASEEVFPTLAILGKEAGFKWKNELVRGGLTTINHELLTMFPDYLHKNYKLSLFFEYIKKQRGGHLNICEFIKSTEYFNVNELHYSYLNTYAEKIKYLKPLDNLLRNFSDPEMDGLKKGFSNFIFAYNYQVPELIPYIDELSEFNFVEDLQKIVLSENLLPLTQWLNDSVIGGQSITFIADFDGLVNIEALAEPDNVADSKAIFFVELYPIIKDANGVVLKSDPIEEFDENNMIKQVSLDAGKEYALIFSQSDFSAQLDNKLVNFGFTVTQPAPLKAFLSQKEYHSYTPTRFQGIDFYETSSNTTYMKLGRRLLVKIEQDIHSKMYYSSTYKFKFSDSQTRRSTTVFLDIEKLGVSGFNTKIGELCSENDLYAVSCINSHTLSVAGNRIKEEYFNQTITYDDGPLSLGKGEILSLEGIEDLWATHANTTLASADIPEKSVSGPYIETISINGDPSIKVLMEFNFNIVQAEDTMVAVKPPDSEIQKHIDGILADIRSGAVNWEEGRRYSNDSSVGDYYLYNVKVLASPTGSGNSFLFADTYYFSVSLIVL
ncbi:MAG: hypothetical protein HOO06_14675 [Bdellovibrionaceae bacterium]|jgi:hypothetical protein|nr:hypothetical protein [Pseudobdellovibrionaceae bacterium]